MAKTPQGRRIELEIQGLIEQATGRLQLRTLQALTSATPVDTGFARAVWTPSVGTPNTTPMPRPKTGANARARELKRANLAKAKALASFYRVRMGPAFLTNNAPYIVFLNEGSSAQAGPKFVERAVEKAMQSLGTFKLL